MQRSIIDHCYARDESTIKCITVENIGDSDHYCVKFKKVTKTAPNKEPPIKTHNYNQINLEEFLRDIYDANIDEKVIATL